MWTTPRRKVPVVITTHLARSFSPASVHTPATPGCATKTGTCGTPEAGTRTAHALRVPPPGQAALRLRYVAGWHV
jgi:hypothetical protein